MYKIIDTLLLEDVGEFPTRLSPVVKSKPTFSFKGYDLPNTMDCTQ